MAEVNEIGPEFYTHLETESYAKPGFFDRLVADYGLEYAITYMIDDCGVEIFQYIRNPSHPVIIRAIRHAGSIIEKICCPTIEMKMASVNADPKKYFPIYQSEFTEDQLLEIINQDVVSEYSRCGFIILKYIAEPSRAVIAAALHSSPYAIKYLKNNKNLDLELHEYIVDHVSYLDDDTLSKFKYFTPKIVEKIKNSYQCLIKYIPKEYYTAELVETAVKKNAQNMSDVPEKYITQELCDTIVQKNKRDFRFVPGKYQTDSMKTTAITAYPDLLNYCEIITFDLVATAFNNEQHKPRIKRLDFVNNYSHQEILKVAAVYGNILRVLLPKNLTEEIIKTALKANGWALQYLDTQTDEYIQIAIESEPGAAKHIKK